MNKLDEMSCFPSKVPSKCSFKVDENGTVISADFIEIPVLFKQSIPSISAKMRKYQVLIF